MASQFNSRSPLYFNWTIAFALAFLPLCILPMLLYRWILKLWVLASKGQHLIKHHGSLFLRHSMDKEPHMNLVVGFRLGGVVDMNGVKELIKKRIVNKWDPDKGRLAYPELQEYCVRRGGYHFWTPESDFGVEDHMEFREVPVEGASDEAVGQLIVKFMQAPFPAQRSPWQILLLQIGREWHYLLLKFHHSMADGYSWMRAVIECSDNPVTLLQNPDSKQSSHLGARLLQALTFTARILPTFCKILTIRNPPMPWKPFPLESFTYGPRRHFVSVTSSQRVSLVNIKRVAQVHNVSVTAVIYAGLTGAIRTLFAIKYGLERVPEDVSFPQPVPTRKHPEGLCNSLCSVTFRLPLGEPSPAARLTACEQMLRETKGRSGQVEAWITFWMLQLTALLPCWVPFRWCKPGVMPCVGSTNIVGPLKTISFNGAPVLSINVLPGTNPHPCYASFMSYDGWLEWTCNGDTRVFSQADVEEFGRLIGAEFEVLAELKPEMVV